MTNDWCRTLDIEPPTLDAVAHHQEANTFALLRVALLELGRLMTLAEAAMRWRKRASLRERRRCRRREPTFVFQGELFFGADRLPMLDWRLRHPRT
jgi:hypothetical protein